ncbi:uncharacterized protein LOC133777697 [Humulus lupulus]|uniref:uncharacterized protein LOC133777697 n=1 Tax=Humulus lupulus TaxID=3486 RepID=UPI002B4152AD|nr:uncharacterized protein LOC133777697 [Humulus lupulus]
MAKGAKMQGKARVSGKKKKRGPTSSNRGVKTRSMDEILGVKELEFADEEDEPSKQLGTDVATGKLTSPPILRFGKLVENLDSSFVNLETEEELKDKEQMKRTVGVKIELEDIEEEINYWQSVIVCYVIGANPPLHVLERFVRRIWKHHGVDKVGTLSHGVFIVRFQNMEDRDKVINVGYIFLDKKPLIMKRWNSSDDFTKEDVKTVPIWVQLGGLDIKYWGDKALFKIVGQLGKPIQVDNITKRRERLHFPRIMVEVSITQAFPHTISFINELDQDIELTVKYEWLHVCCEYCKGLGHTTPICKKKGPTTGAAPQTWVPKKSADGKLTKGKKQVVKADGFQKVVKGKKSASISGQYHRGA